MTTTVTEDIRKELAAVKRRLKRLEERMPLPRDPEGELSEQTKRDLARARAAPASSYVSMDVLERDLRARRAKVSK
jgi:hypothetical protein